jgi:hypothetical protein
VNCMRLTILATCAVLAISWPGSAAAGQTQDIGQDRFSPDVIDAPATTGVTPLGSLVSLVPHFAVDGHHFRHRAMPEMISAWIAAENSNVPSATSTASTLFRRQSTTKQADSVWNGALIGAGVGAVGGFIWARRICGGNDQECFVISAPVGVLGGAGIGAAIGAIVDALHK